MTKHHHSVSGKQTSDTDVPSPDFAPHCWTFGIEQEAPIAGLVNYTSISDRVDAAGLDIQLEEYCGDDSIMVMARKGSA